MTHALTSLWSFGSSGGWRVGRRNKAYALPALRRQGPRVPQLSILPSQNRSLSPEAISCEALVSQENSPPYPTAMCFSFFPLKPMLTLSYPTLPSLICTLNLSHPALYKYMHIFHILNTDPQFLVQKPGGQMSCGIQNISDFRNRFSIRTTYYKSPCGIRASISYANSFMFWLLDAPVGYISSGVSKDYASLQANPGQALLPNDYERTPDIPILLCE